jgi:hypothetical protein
MAKKEYRRTTRVRSEDRQGAHLLRGTSLLPSRLGGGTNVQTAKIGSLVDVNESQDAEGLRVFYYLVQDLKVRHLFTSSLHGCIANKAVLHLLTDYTTFQD